MANPLSSSGAATDAARHRFLLDLAATFRRLAILTGPCDYVPSDLELEAERRPQLDAAEACEAGAAALVRVSAELSAWQSPAEWQPLTPALLRELALEVRTFGREPSVWAISPENLARRLEEAATAIEERPVQTSAD